MTATTICTRKKMTEAQAGLVAQRVGLQTGSRKYAKYCDRCKAWHVVGDR